MGETVPRISGGTRPRLATHVRMRPDRATGGHVLLGPETVVVLNASGYAVLALCDGVRTLDEIVDTLVAGHDGADPETVGTQVRDYLVRLAGRNLVSLAELR